MAPAALASRLRCGQISIGKLKQNPLDQRAEELEDGNKREKGDGI